MEKKYSKKDFFKICVIIAIITVPLLIAYGAAGYFEEDGIEFWSDWDCDQMTTFAMSSEFNKLTDEKHMQYNLDMSPCIEEP
ncbi:MAG: hypothetical protein OEM79_07360 [Nitrosopumilus sp.]|nr:hypothetical protein [Nitrosopumilus sp.]